MKKNIVLAAVVISFTAMTALAQMMGNSKGTGDQQHQMGSHQSQQMMGGQMMNQGMMRDMSSIMGQMNEIMQKMSQSMEQQNGMDRTNMQEMSKIMNEMSVTMRVMSQQMAKGNMDTALMKKMQDRINTMNQIMGSVEKGRK